MEVSALRSGSAHAVSDVRKSPAGDGERADEESRRKQ
jgi:hypothetical protein